MDLTPFLEDLETRIVPAEEERIFALWNDFIRHRNPRNEFFCPERHAAAESKLIWRDIPVNQAILDPTYEFMLLQQLGNANKLICSGAGFIPCIRCNYGSSILPTVMGCNLYIMEESLNTLPTALPAPGGTESIKKLMEHGVPDLNHGQGRAVLECAQFFMETLKDYPNVRKYIRINHPDLQGILDVAELICGSEIFLLIYDEPQLIQNLLEIVYGTYCAFIERYFKIVPPDYNGPNAHSGWLHPGKIRISLDSCVNFSGEMYRELVFPFDKKLMNRYGAVVHSCGRVDHFTGILAETGHGYYGFNVSQPHLNDMEAVFDATIRRGIPLYCLNPKGVNLPADDTRGLISLASPV